MFHSQRDRRDDLPSLKRWHDTDGKTTATRFFRAKGISGDALSFSYAQATRLELAESLGEKPCCGELDLIVDFLP